MKKRIYIETTVVSYLTAKPSRDIMIAGHQEATRELWVKLLSGYEAYISALVFQEAGRGDPVQAQARLSAIAKLPMLDINDEAQSLAEKIITQKGIPAEYPEDALHIAIAAVNGIEVIITWNFAHLNNPFTRKKVRKIVDAEGYSCPEVCSPEELLEVEE
jgi:predicted nucleic acid-binding protein